MASPYTAPTPPTVKATRYYPLLDAFRFFAAISIIWLHIAGVPWLERSKVLGRFAVPFFTCAATFLAFDTLRRRPDTSVPRYFSGRFWRIYPLFLAWSVVYLLVRSASSLLLENKGWVRFTAREFLLDGVAIQLWFLPFIIVATTASFAVSKLVRTVPAARVAMVGAMVATGLLAAVFPSPTWVQQAGYLPWLSYGALPAGAWGIALGLLIDHGPACPAVPPPGIPPTPEPLVPAPVAAAGALAFGLWLVLALLYGRSLLMENVAGLGLFLVALSRVSFRPVPVLAVLGSISLGIYLAHALFVEGLQHVLPKLGVAPGGGRDVMILLAALTGSCALSLLLKRGGRWTAWLAG